MYMLVLILALTPLTSFGAAAVPDVLRQNVVEAERKARAAAQRSLAAEVNCDCVSARIALQEGKVELAEMHLKYAGARIEIRQAYDREVDGREATYLIAQMRQQIE